MDIFDLRLWPSFASAGGDLSAPSLIDQIAIDSRRIDSNQALFVPLKGTQTDGHKFVSHAAASGARYAIVQKDWYPSQPIPNIKLLRVDDPITAFQSIAATYRKQKNCKVVAITGSYGKTMVKDLLEMMIGTVQCVVSSPESFNSQIGVSLSLLNITNDHEIALIEAGISQKNEMDALANMIAPDFAILTHVGKKHITLLGDLETTTSEIVKLLLCVPQTNWVLAPNTQLLQPHFPLLQATPYFWNELTNHLPHAKLLTSDHSAKMPYEIEFPDGTHFAADTSHGYYYFLDLINITIKAAWLLGISSDAIRRTLSQYIAEPMRTEIWKTPLGTTFVNDTYCSDPQSVDLALQHLEHRTKTGKKNFVFSGMRGINQHTESDYRHIGQAINRTKLDRLMLVGKHPFTSLIEEVQKHSPKTEIFHYPTHNDAYDGMKLWIQKDDTVLIKGEKKQPLDAISEAFNDSISNNMCFINLAAIQSNITALRHKLPANTRIMVMVKALAYGTNDIRIGQFLGSCGIDIFGVSYVDEGVSLKRAGITQSIFVLNAAIYESAKVVKWDLEVGVSEKEIIDSLEKEAALQQKKIKVHLHVDTGMSRFGCRPEEAFQLATYIKNKNWLILEGIMTHFACADNPEEDEFTFSQADKLEKIVLELKNAGIDVPWQHAANSSGVIRFHFPQFNMVRIGLAVYGLHSSKATQKVMDLRLALSLMTRIVGINTCKLGETISYGRTYSVTKEKQRIGVLPIGYFDGLHRIYSGKGEVIIRGKKVPMVGKICMDFMMVDVTNIPNASVGDSVLIFGEDEYGHFIAPEDLAALADSIVYELVTCLGPRIQRIFIYEEAHQRHW